MNSFRKWLYRPKKTDTSLLAQFYFADDDLNQVAAELDSFDGRKDPERCTMLVNHLRVCQDKVLTVIQRIMVDAIDSQRANRDFRVKFPDDVLQDSLAGQLWFGAECLAAGSSILNREVESASMRPLARALTKNLDFLRAVMRDQCLRNCSEYSDKIKEALVIFDKLFAEFELSYVSAMVPVKTMKEYDMLQEVTVLFSETVHRALKLCLLSQDMIDDCDPALMFTIPRLAIVCGLLVYPDGPLNPDMEPTNMTEMFRPFQTLLYKIRELLHTLSSSELSMLEKALCSSEEPEVTTHQSVASQSESLLHIDCRHPEALLQVDQGFHEGGEGIVSIAEIGSNIMITPPDSDGLDCPVTPVNSNAGELDVGTISPSSTIVEEELQHSSLEEGSLNKSESQDSGLQSENVSTSDTVTVETPNIVSHDDSPTECSLSSSSDDQLRESAGEVKPCDNVNDDNEEESERDIDSVCDSDNNKTSSTDPHDGDVCDSDASKTLKTIQNYGILHQYCPEDIDSEILKLCEALVDEVVLSVSSDDPKTNKLGEDDTVNIASNGNVDLDTDCSKKNCDIDNIDNSKPSCESANTGVELNGEENEHGAAGGPNVQRQFSWQYNVQFALPCIPLPGDRDLDRQSADSFSSDSTLSENCGQPESVTDFVIETLANMNAVSELREAESCQETMTAKKTRHPSNGKSKKASAKAKSGQKHGNKSRSSNSTLSSTQTSSTHCKTRNQVDLSLPSTSEESSSDRHRNKRTKTKVMSAQDKRDSVENISCVVGAHGDSNVDKCCTTGDGPETVTKSMTPKTNSPDEAGTDLPTKTVQSTNTVDSQNTGKRKSEKAGDRVKTKGARGTSSVERRASQTSTPSDGTSISSSCSSCRSSSSMSCDCDSEQQCHCVGSETSSFNSECSSTNDDEEIALAIHAAEIASRNEARARFRSSSDLIHRLFVCIAGVADQLQTNYASDLRHILKCVFEMNTYCEDVETPAPVPPPVQNSTSTTNANSTLPPSTPPSDNNENQSTEVPESNTNTDSSNQSGSPSESRNAQPGDETDTSPESIGSGTNGNLSENSQLPNNQTVPSSNQSTSRTESNEAPAQTQSRAPSSTRRIFDEPPEWVPDSEVERCTACKTPFTFVRRRHHCRNCGKIFCGKCSSTTVPLPQYGHQKPVRVCHRCFLYQVSHFTVSHQY